jgi:hypothetical protein
MDCSEMRPDSSVGNMALTLYFMRFQKDIKLFFGPA